MIRSLFAVIAAVIVGLAFAKFIEGGLAALFGVEMPSPAYQAVLAFSWFVAALLSGVIALMIGRRWAPLGILCAATILLHATMSLASQPLSWLMWPGALLTTSLGGFLAVRFTHATKQPGGPPKKETLFDD